jgi:hypothetical protein
MSVTLEGQTINVNVIKATGPGNYRVVVGTPQAVVDYLTENRIPEQKIKGSTFTSSSELCVLFHL